MCIASGRCSRGCRRPPFPQFGKRRTDISGWARRAVWCALTVCALPPSKTSIETHLPTSGFAKFSKIQTTRCGSAPMMPVSSGWRMIESRPIPRRTACRRTLFNVSFPLATETCGHALPRVWPELPAAQFRCTGPGKGSARTMSGPPAKPAMEPSGREARMRGSACGTGPDLSLASSRRSRAMPASARLGAPETFSGLARRAA